MTFNISLENRENAYAMQMIDVGQKSTANSPNLETIIKNNLEDNGNDEKFFCGRDIKTKQSCSIQKRNCDEAHCKMGRFGFFGYFGGTKMALRVPESKF